MKAETHASDLKSDRFELQRLLGRGGVGAVYQAYDREKNKTVAVKILGNLNAMGIARYKKSFEALKHIDHPNLIKLDELFHHEEQCFFSMDLVEGLDFLSYVRPGGIGPNEKRLRSCLQQLAVGVVKLHQVGRVHGDIKPHNILVTDTGRVVLLDLDLVAEVLAGRQLGNAASVGTRAYMAPEQSTGSPVGAPADWYSVGIVLYEALTGRRPFLGSGMHSEMQKHTQQPKPPLELALNTPSDLNALCVDLLHYRPEDRVRDQNVLVRLKVEEDQIPRRVSLLPSAEASPEAAPFVGRKEELTVLREAFHQCQSGVGVNFFVSGEAGIGKTALVQEMYSQIRDEHKNVVFLNGRFTLGTSVHYQAFASIVAQLCILLRELVDFPKLEDNSQERDFARLLGPEDTICVVSLFPELRGVQAIYDGLNPTLEIPNPQEVQTRAFIALRSLLTTVARKRLVILFLDDLHWADPDSLDLLKVITQPNHAPPMFFLTTVREELEEVIGVGDLVPNGHRLRLKGLEKTESLDLCRALLRANGQNVDTIAELEEIADEAQGHPLFLGEIVRHMMSSPGKSRWVGLEEALWSRIENLDEGPRHLLELITLAGVPITDTDLADTAGMEMEDCIRGLSVLLFGHLIRSGRANGEESTEPYHDRVKETILAHIDPEKKRSHHWNLACVLGQSDRLGDLEVVVFHLEEAGKHEKAAELAERTGVRACEVLAFRQAARLFRRALDLGECTILHRRHLMMKLGDALCNSGNGAQASEIYLTAREGADFSARLSLHRQAVTQLFLAGHLEEGIFQLDALLLEIGERLARTPRTALVSLLWHRAKVATRGLGWRERMEASIDPKELARLDIYQIVSDALGMIDNIRGADYQSRSLLLALKTGESRRVCHSMNMEAIFQTAHAGRITPRISHLLKTAKNIAEKSNDRRLFVMSEGGAGISDYLSGRFKEALAAINRVESMLRDQTVDSTWTLNNCRLFRMRTLRMLGHYRDLRKSFDEYIWDSKRRGDFYMETTLRVLGHHVFLSEDVPELAHGNLTKIKWVPPVGTYHLQHWYELLARAEIALYEGKVPELIRGFEGQFVQVRKSLLLRMTTLRAETWWLYARLFLAAASRGVEPDRLRHQASAVTRKMMRDRTGFPHTIVWAQAIRAALSAQSGNSTKAIELLQSALLGAERGSLSPLAAAIRIRLEELAPSAPHGAIETNEGYQWMKNNGISNPTKMAEIFTPGFPKASKA